MKVLRYLVAACFVLGLTGVASAFQFKVLDPSVSQTTFPAVNVGGANPITFFSCAGTGITGDGCFGLGYAGEDGTLTSFQGTINSPIALPDSTDSSSICPSGGQGTFTDAFSVVNCSISNNVITIDLSGAPGITGPALFFLVEDGVPAGDFLDGQTYGSFTVSTTPEPSSLLLALSSLGPLGYAIRRRRKSA